MRVAEALPRHAKGPRHLRRGVHGLHRKPAKSPAFVQSNVENARRRNLRLLATIIVQVVPVCVHTVPGSRSRLRGNLQRRDQRALAHQLHTTEAFAPFSRAFWGMLRAFEAESRPFELVHVFRDAVLAHIQNTGRHELANVKSGVVGLAAAATARRQSSRAVAVPRRRIASAIGSVGQARERRARTHARRGSYLQGQLPTRAPRRLTASFHRNF
jgi:hypothetical protein